MKKLFIVAILSLIAMTMWVAAQDYPATGTLCDEDIPRQLLGEINQARINNNVLPLVFNSSLCTSANSHLQDLQTRPETRLGNLYQGSDGSVLSDWLERDGYQTYPTGYNARHFVWTGRSSPPQPRGDNWLGVTNYLLSNVNPDAAAFPELVQSPNYREIGIAYNVIEQINGQTRYYYVFIFGSQPNVFPVVPIDTDTREPIYDVRQPDISLLIHTERRYPEGQPNVMGRIVSYRFAQGRNDIQTCPSPDSPSLPEGWRQYSYGEIVPYNAIGTNGQRSIFIQLCDFARNPIVASAQINYLGSEIQPTATDTPITATATTDPEEFVNQTLTAIFEQTQTQAASDEARTPTADIAATQLALDTQVAETVNVRLTEVAIDAARSATVTDTAIPSDTPSVTATDTVTPSDTPSVTATDRATPSATITDITTATHTESPPITVTGTSLPFEELHLYWNQEFMVLYNAGDEVVSLDDIALLRFTALGGNQNFSGEIWPDTLQNNGIYNVRELRHGRCLVVFDLDRPGDAPDPDEVEDVFTTCNTPDTITAWAGAGPNQLVWFPTNDAFEVYFNDMLIGTCDLHQEMNQCILPQ